MADTLIDDGREHRPCPPHLGQLVTPPLVRILAQNITSELLQRHKGCRINNKNNNDINTKSNNVNNADAEKKGANFLSYFKDFIYDALVVFIWE